MTNTKIERKLAVILVADVVGYSKHMENDENATLEAYSECEKILEELLNIKQGSIISKPINNHIVVNISHHFFPEFKLHSKALFLRVGCLISIGALVIKLELFIA